MVSPPASSGETRDGDLADHMTQPRGDVHSRVGRCLLNLLMEVGCDVEGQVVDWALRVTLVGGAVGPRLRPYCMM